MQATLAFDYSFEPETDWSRVLTESVQDVLSAISITAFACGLVVFLSVFGG